VRVRVPCEMCYTEPDEVRARNVSSGKWEVLSAHGDKQLFHNGVSFGLPSLRRGETLGCERGK